MLNIYIVIILWINYKDVILLLKIHMNKRKNFLEICIKFGRAPSKMFTSPVIACRSFVQCISPPAPCPLPPAPCPEPQLRCFFVFHFSSLILILLNIYTNFIAENKIRKALYINAVPINFCPRAISLRSFTVRGNSA